MKFYEKKPIYLFGFDKINYIFEFYCYCGSSFTYRVTGWFTVTYSCSSCGWQTVRLRAETIDEIRRRFSVADVSKSTVPGSVKENEHTISRKRERKKYAICGSPDKRRWRRFICHYVTAVTSGAVSPPGVAGD